MLAERVGQGEVGGYTALPDTAWWQLQLPVEKALVKDGWPICLLSSIENTSSFHYTDSISGNLGSISSK